MTTTAAIDFTYRYAFASGVAETSRGTGLSLATCGARHEQPYFFDGTLLAPRETGLLLLVLSDIVRTHFFLPRPVLTDPVVTSNETVLRFEGFSGCCGVYARADIPAEAFRTDHIECGTTNVDFNNRMRAALTRLRDDDDIRLAIGSTSVELFKGNEAVVEKKVPLPLRWIKGFSEVQLYQPTMQVKLETNGVEGRRFLRSLPNSDPPKKTSYATQIGKAIRLSQRASAGAVPFHGTHRVRVLEPLLNSAQNLSVWCDDESGVTAWEVTLRSGRFFLMLSPEVYRGFSGEGQALATLAGNQWQAALPIVQDQLQWQSRLDVDDLARETNLPRAEVAAALALLGARGLAGYDANRATYFHRQLPFEFDKVEQLQPRLRAARRLLEKGGLKLLPQSTSSSFRSETTSQSETSSVDVDVEVPGSSDVPHLVRLRTEGDKCSCPWYSKHLGKRGPCKHILAAQLLLEQNVTNCESECHA